MIFEIILTLVIAFCITLMVVHYYIYHKENDFVVKKIDMNANNNRHSQQKLEKSMKEREIIYIQNFNTTHITLDFLRKNIKNKTGLEITALDEKDKKYSMPLKEWYGIYKKRKHKMLYVYPDRKTLTYFDYDTEIYNNMNYLLGSRFYYLVSNGLRYYSQKTMRFFENVDNFYRIVIPLDGDADIRLVSPSRKGSLYLHTLNSNTGGSSIISGFNSDTEINYKEFPKARNLKYVTISVKKNDMVMVPYNWSYTIVNYKGLCIEGDMENLCSSVWKYLGGVITGLNR
jgi:hypothetical protein